LNAKFPANSLLQDSGLQKNDLQVLAAATVKYEIPVIPCSIPSAFGKICRFWAEVANFGRLG
jgi:hypothetical protein